MTLTCLLQRGGGDGRRRRGRSGSTVRFYDDMDADSHIHGLHQDIRDISSEQLRLEDDLSREIDRRNKSVIYYYLLLYFLCAMYLG